MALPRHRNLRRRGRIRRGHRVRPVGPGRVRGADQRGGDDDHGPRPGQQLHGQRLRGRRLRGRGDRLLGGDCDAGADVAHGQRADDGGRHAHARGAHGRLVVRGARPVERLPARERRVRRAHGSAAGPRLRLRRLRQQAVPPRRQHARDGLVHDALRAARGRAHGELGDARDQRLGADRLVVQAHRAVRRRRLPRRDVRAQERRALADAVDELHLQGVPGRGLRGRDRGRLLQDARPAPQHRQQRGYRDAHAPQLGGGVVVPGASPRPRQRDLHVRRGGHRLGDHPRRDSPHQPRPLHRRGVRRGGMRCRRRDRARGVLPRVLAAGRRRERHGDDGDSPRVERPRRPVGVPFDRRWRSVHRSLHQPQ